jgi:hypothetical protein
MLLDGEVVPRPGRVRYVRRRTPKHAAPMASRMQQTARHHLQNEADQCQNLNRSHYALFIRDFHGISRHSTRCWRPSMYTTRPRAKEVAATELISGQRQKGCGSSRVLAGFVYFPGDCSVSHGSDTIATVLLPAARNGSNS